MKMGGRFFFNSVTSEIYSGSSNMYDEVVLVKSIIALAVLVHHLFSCSRKTLC